MKKTTILLITLFVTFLSCEEIKYVDALPQLQITVVDQEGTLVEGAQITLYATYEEWYNVENPLDSGITDISGKFVFEDLQEVYYFFDIVKGEELSNSLNATSLSEPLKIGVRTNVTVIIN